MITIEFMEPRCTLDFNIIQVVAEGTTAKRNSVHTEELIDLLRHSRPGNIVDIVTVSQRG